MDAALERKSEEDSSSESETTEVSLPGPDIEAIMTVIRRRTRYYQHGEPERLDLHETHLRGAYLREANLSGANLMGANLSAAKNLTQEQLEETIGDANTKLPPDLKPPADWNVKTDEQIEGP